MNHANVAHDLLWVNILKSISILAVVVLHVSAKVVTGIPDTTSLHWWIGNSFDSGVRWAVPVFVMVSGALLLNPSKKESTRQFIKKRISRILIPVVFWTLAYFAFVYIYGQLQIKTALFRILFGKPYYHLWYIYMIIGLL